MAQIFKIFGINSKKFLKYFDGILVKLKENFE